MATTCASCGTKFGFLDRLSGRQLCDSCEQKRARAQQAADDALITDAQRGILQGSTTSPHVMNLNKGELVHYTITGATLMKVARSYQRTSGGVSIPVGKSGIRTYIGQSRGKVITTGVEPADSGTFIVTSQRCIFTGAATTEILDYKNLLDVKVFEDGLQFSRYNRKTPVLIRLGTATEVVATLMDVAVQKRLGTWQELESPTPVPAPAEKLPEPPTATALSPAKRQVVEEAFKTLMDTFERELPPALRKEIEERVSLHDLVVQGALRLAGQLTSSDADEVPQEIEAMAILLRKYLPEASEAGAQMTVQDTKFREAFHQPLDDGVFLFGGIADADRQLGTKASLVLGDAIMEFGRVICSIDDSIGSAELETLRAYEDVLRLAMSKNGISPTGSEGANESATEAPIGDGEHQPGRTPDNILAELESLVGLEAVKREVRDMVNFLRVQKMRREEGLIVGEFTHHLIFAGGPGTGKTTVGRLIAELYAALDVVPQGQLVEATRSDFVAGYAGQTAIKTTEILRQAIGGVLFIDEAYTLNQGTQDSFGQEAIDALVKLMEDHRQELVVIAAGYTDRMESFIDQNPGLESRFKRTLMFDDYSPAQLMEIFGAIAHREGYELEEHVLDEVEKVIRSSPADVEAGNARFVRRLFEGAVVNQANRLASLPAPTRQDLVRLIADDIEQVVASAGEPNAPPPAHGAGAARVRVSVAGREIEDACAAVIDYVRRHERTVAEYDLVDRGDPNQLSPEEVTRTRLIASRISNEELQWFVEVGRDAPWSQVVFDLDLGLCDPLGSSEYDAVDALYAHFYGQRPKSVSVGKIHKVLHVKRPNTFPILDSRLRLLYRPAARAAARQLATRSDRWKGTREHYWEAIRLDLVRNRNDLEQLRRQLAGEGELGTMAAQLSDLRLLDVLTWPLEA